MAQMSGVAQRSGPRSIPVYSYLARHNRGYYLAGYSLPAFLGLWTAFPFYWQLATSLRADVDLYTPVVNLIPRELTLNHYYNVMFGANSQFPIQFRNSMVVALGATVVAVVLGSLAGYALTRL
jgi:multiple sugar transport system permease protein